MSSWSFHQPRPLHESCTNVLRNVAIARSKQKVEAMCREREVRQINRPILTTHIDVNMEAKFDATTLHFRINKQTPMRRLMHSFAYEKSMDCRKLLFYYNGHQMFEYSKPEDYGLEDDANIDVCIKGGWRVKPYKCRHCKECFARKDQLQAHVRTHAVEKQTTHINVFLRSLTGRTDRFSLEKQAPVREIMQAYADREGVTVDGIRCIWQGTQLWDTDTPNLIGMKDGAMIHVIQKLRGS